MGFLDVDESGDFLYPAGKPIDELQNYKIREQEDQNPFIVNKQTEMSSEDAHDKRAAQQIEQSKNGEFSIFNSTGRAVAHGGINAINEIDKFFGLTNSLQEYAGVGLELGEDEVFFDADKHFKLTPRNTYESILSTITQFAVPYGVISKVGAVQKATKMAGLFTKSPKLKLAADSILIGAPVDAAFFDPNDPNVGNFIISTAHLSEDEGVGGLIKQYLATDPDDSPAVNRARNALAGGAAGVIAEGVIRMVGGVVKGGKAIKNEITKKEAVEAGKEQAEIFIQGLDEFKANADPEQLKLFSDNLPGKLSEVDPELKVPEIKKGTTRGAIKGVKDDAEISLIKDSEVLGPTVDPVPLGIPKDSPVPRPVEGHLARVETLAKMTPEQIDTIGKTLIRISKGEDVKIKDWHMPLNLFNLRAPHEIRQAIHVIGEITQKQLPRNKPLGDQIADLSDLLSIEPSAIREQLQLNAKSVEEATRYITGAKHFVILETKKQQDAVKKYLASKKTTSDEIELNKQIVETTESIHAAAGMSTAFGRGLQSYNDLTKFRTVTQEADVLRGEILNRAIRVKKEGSEVFANQHAKLHKFTKEQTEELRKFLQRQENLFKGRDQAEVLQEILDANLIQLRGMNNYVKLTKYARTRRALSEIYINGLLSNPKTNIINIAGNVSAIGTSIFERAWAGLRNTSHEGIAIEETGHLVQGLWDGIKDIPRVFSKAWKDGPADLAVKADFMKAHDRALTKENFGASGALGQAIDYFATLTNLPGRLLLSADEVFKHVNMNAERNALAYRKARNALVKDPETKAEYRKLAELKARFLDDEEVVKQASEAAKVNTFTNNLWDKEVRDPTTGKIIHVAGFTKQMQRAIESDPTGLLKIIVPFFKTPVNLMRFAGQRIPVLNKFSGIVKKELTSPDLAVRQLAEARAATGSMMVATGMYWGWNGMATGAPPLNRDLAENEKQARIQPYSVRNPFTGVWINYNRFDPLGMLIASGANIARVAKAAIALNAHVDEYGYTENIRDKYYELFGEFSMGLGRLLSDRHYLQSFAMLADALSGDPYAWNRLTGQVGTAINPGLSFYSSLKKGIARSVDPEVKSKIKESAPLAGGPSDQLFKEAVDYFTNLEKIMTDAIPGMNDDFSRLNIVGQPTHYPGSGNDALHNTVSMLFNPAAGDKLTEHPLLLKVAELGVKIGSAAETHVIEGVELTPEEAHFFAKTWGEKNEKLTSWVQSKGFNSLSTNRQADRLTTKILSNRDNAKGKTLRKFDRIRNERRKIVALKRSEQRQPNPLANITGIFTPQQ